MMWQMLICPKKYEDEWHHKKCLYGQCSDYGIKKNPLCRVECNGFNLNVVEWKRFAMETTMSKVEHPLKKLTFVYKKTNNEKSIEYFKPKLQKKFKHNFVLRWQNKQFKASISPSTKTQLFLLWTLLKIIHLKCKMKCNLCSGI